MSDKYGLHRDDFGVQVTFIGQQGNICLSNAEIVKHLNGHNNTCEKLTEQNKILREQIAHERIDKHAIITNHLNVLAECIMAVPVPERDREANIKMRDAILNVMASSVEGIR